MIGVSTHSLNEAFEAQQQGADFVLFGPVYFTPSKATYGPPQGLNKLKEIVEKILLPVYAIGGINLENILNLRSLGVSRVALISAIMSSDAPKKSTTDLLRMIGSA
jgi:thiamine-phosphate pyrophosphorylase